jgi:hypothetical protein
MTAARFRARPCRYPALLAFLSLLPPVLGSPLRRNRAIGEKPILMSRAPISGDVDVGRLRKLICPTI